MSELDVVKMTRTYKTLTTKQEGVVRKLAVKNISQKKIALTLKVSKQRVATFMRQEGLGKRRPWAPVGNVIRGRADGWQLTCQASFQNQDSGEIKEDIECYGKFHVVKDYGRAFNECMESGRATCGGDYQYEETNENWMPIDVYKQKWNHWIPAQKTLGDAI